MVISSCGTSAGDGTLISTIPSTTTPTTSTSSTTTTTRLPTTTTLPPTTTTSLLEGNWAKQPLVAYDDWGGMALGWWDGTRWVQVDAETVLPVVGGEDYQVALLGSQAILEGGPPQNTGCDVVLPDAPMPGIQFDDGNALYTIVDDGQGGERFVSGVAISAPWNLRPRPVTDGETHPDLEALAAGLLAERGYTADAVNLVQAVDADLDGDGTIETLVVAEQTELANDMSDVYSLLFAVSPAWDEAVVVVESVIPADDTGFPASFRVSAVADLSGDGRMELVVDGQAWENGWVTVHELTQAGFEHRIGAGCGV